MTTKLTIVGAGQVGATTGFAAVIRELVDSIVIVNRSREKAEGEAADLCHAAAFVGRSIRVQAGEIEDSRNSDVVALTLSVPAASGVKFDRTSLAEGNVALFRHWIPLSGASGRTVARAGRSQCGVGRRFPAPAHPISKTEQFSRSL